MSIKLPADIASPVEIDLPEKVRITRTSNATTLYGDGRYYLLIKTAPHDDWHPPAGWYWDDLSDAKRGARKADSLWMAVRLMDGATGQEIEI